LPSTNRATNAEPATTTTPPTTNRVTVHCHGATKSKNTTTAGLSSGLPNQ